MLDTINAQNVLKTAGSMNFEINANLDRASLKNFVI